MIFHDDGRLPRRDPIAALAEDGDRVSVTHAVLPSGLVGRGHAIDWAHDAEALVLAQQADAALPVRSSAQTDVLEVAWNPTAGRRPRAERAPLPTSSPLWRRAVLAAARRYLSGARGTDADGVIGSAVRAAAADVLQALHAERDPATGLPRYDRVVVIGTGLGSVVGYAAVHDCWARRDPQADAATAQQAPVRELERIRRRLAVADTRLRAEGGREAPEGLQADVATLRAEYRRHQAALAALLRERAEQPERRWIVSDLVTMGSPLARHDVLVPRGSARSHREPCDRVHAGELSACPPPAGWEAAGASGAFGPVRWTNLWFANDGLAGPVGGHLGSGVEDIDLGGPRGLPALGIADRHARYWAPAGGQDAEAGLCSAVLRRLVRRRPTLLLASAGPIDAAVLVERLRVAARYPTARGAVLVDVRLGVLDGGQVRTRYLPTGPLPLPADLALRDVRAALGPGGRTALLLNDIGG